MSDPTAERGAPDTVESPTVSTHPPMSARTLALGSLDGDPSPAAPRAVQRGTSIGRYLVVSLLGRGGMGEVYAAYDPELDRRVAVKLLHTTARSWAARQRLVREARALGRLSHPNVVQVHDVGEHEGDVFVAMELIEGESLDAWCRGAPPGPDEGPSSGSPKPGWREVLAAYLDAARGLSAAHEKGIVHRDVKPSNILRGKDGRVRIVDFGLATRGTEDLDEGEGTAAPATSAEEPLTVAGALLGTPRYMAPEQHRSPAGSAAADQYSLCVALYEGLYGAPPFSAIEQGSPTEIRAELLERKQAGPPGAPPAGTPVPAWVHAALARGLAVEPGDRYPSVAALAAVLGDDPEARRRTRRRLAGAVVAAVAMLVAGTAGWVRRGSAANPCEHPEQHLAGVWDEGVRGRVRAAFAGTGRSYAEGTAARAIALLDRYAEGWVAQRGALCEAALRGPRRQILDLEDVCLERRRSQLQALATLFAEKADPQVLDRAVQAATALPPLAGCTDVEALTARVRPPEDPALRASVSALQPRIDRLEALFAGGKYQDGLALGRPLQAEAAAIPYAPLHAQVGYWMGRLYQDGTNDYAEARAQYHGAALAAAEGGDDALATSALSQLVVVVGDNQRRFEEAAVIRSLGPLVVTRAHDAVAEARWINGEGLVLWRMGKLAEARANLERALAIREKALGPEDPAVGATLLILGLVQGESGDHERALAVLERALAIKEKALGPDHPDVALSLNNLAVAHFHMGDYAGTLPLNERALAVREKALGPDHLLVAQSLNNIGVIHSLLGDFARATEIQERSLAIRQKALGPDHLLVAQTLGNLAETLAATGSYPRALSLHERVLSVREKAQGPAHRDVAESLINTGSVLREMGDLPRAAALQERGLAVYEKARGPDHTETAPALTALGRTEVRLGRLDAAGPRLQRALGILEKAQGPSHVDLAEPLLGLGELYLARRRPDEAVPPLERALPLHDASHQAAIALALAEALWSGHGDRLRARELAAEARADYERIGHGPGAARATGWLAAHAAPPARAR